MDQETFRNLLTVIQIVGGAFCFILYRAYLGVAEKWQRADRANQEISADLAAYKLHVAETYLTSKAMESVLAKLDRIEDKLDKKQDKGN